MAPVTVQMPFTTTSDLFGPFSSPWFFHLCLRASYFCPDAEKCIHFFTATNDIIFVMINY